MLYKTTEGWAPKNQCFHTVVLEKTLESPLDSKDIKPVDPKGNQPWIFIGRTDTDFGHLMQRADSLEKTLMLGKIEGRRKRGWQRMRWLDSITNTFNGHEFEQTPGDSDGQESLCVAGCEVTKNQIRHSNWTTTKLLFLKPFSVLESYLIHIRIQEF